MAYLAIPLVLFFFARRRPRFPFRPVFVLFGLFITACGWTHFMGYYTFYTPIYRLDGLLKLFTALVSWLTVMALVPIIPRAFAMRSPEELENEISARKEAEEKLLQAHGALEERVKQRTAEIHTLNRQLQRAMAETHHRVKNNLQIIAALVDMQVSESGTSVPVAEMARLGQHVRSLAAIHDILTHQARTDSQVTELSTAAAMDRLKAVVEVMTPGRQVTWNIDDIQVPVQYATALAVLVNELVSNATKHGEGAIDITLRQVGDNVRLQVADHGPGFPADFDPNNLSSTGIELIDNLSRWDLAGDVAYSNRPEGGALVTITFPMRSPEAQDPLVP